MQFVKCFKFSVRVSGEIHLSATCWMEPLITCDMCKEDVIKLCMNSNYAIHLCICLVTVAVAVSLDNPNLLVLLFYPGSFNFLGKTSCIKALKASRSFLFNDIYQRGVSEIVFIVSHQRWVGKALLMCFANLRPLTTFCLLKLVWQVMQPLPQSLWH